MIIKPRISSGGGRLDDERITTRVHAERNTAEQHCRKQNTVQQGISFVAVRLDLKKALIHVADLLTFPYSVGRRSVLLAETLGWPD